MQLTGIGQRGTLICGNVGGVRVIDVVVSYILEGEQKESIVTFGSYTAMIIAGKYEEPFAEELTNLYSHRSKEEWYEYFYNYAVLSCWEVWFEWGFIPRDLDPRRFIPAISIISATFPGGWVLYREAKSNRSLHPIYTVKEFLKKIEDNVSKVGNEDPQPEP